MRAERLSTQRPEPAESTRSLPRGDQRGFNASPKRGRRACRGALLFNAQLNHGQRRHPGVRGPSTQPHNRPEASTTITTFNASAPASRDAGTATRKPPERSFQHKHAGSGAPLSCGRAPPSSFNASTRATVQAYDLGFVHWDLFQRKRAARNCSAAPDADPSSRPHRWVGDRQPNIVGSDAPANGTSGLSCWCAFNASHHTGGRTASGPFFIQRKTPWCTCEKSQRRSSTLSTQAQQVARSTASTRDAPWEEPRHGFTDFSFQRNGVVAGSGSTFNASTTGDRGAPAGLSSAQSLSTQAPRSLVAHPRRGLEDHRRRRVLSTQAPRSPSSTDNWLW